MPSGISFKLNLSLPLHYSGSLKRIRAGEFSDRICLLCLSSVLFIQYEVLILYPVNRIALLDGG